VTVPDVRVRLSAEGTDEVIRAFRNVAAEAQKHGKAAGQGIGLLNGALRQLNALLPALTLGAAAVGIAALVKHALEGADAIGRLSQKVGMSSETLSVLSYGAMKSNVEFEKFTKGLGLFNKTMANLDHGNSAAAASVRRLLGDSKALNGLDTEQRFMKVVEALGKMPAGYEKTRAAQEFFGKSGMELIPLLNDLSEGGFARLRKRAEELGLVMSTQMTDAARRAAESLRDVKAEAQGLATQFVTGLAPVLAKTMEDLVKATSGGGNGFTKLGEIAGKTFDKIVKGALFAQNVLDFLWKFLTAENKVGLWTAYQARDLAITKQFEPKLRNNFTELMGAPKPTAEGGNAGEDGAAKAKLAALKAGLADELALYKAQEELLAAEQKRAYDAGKLSIAEYYAARIAAIKTGVADEVLALQEQYDAVQKAPIATEGKSSDQTAAEQTARDAELASLQNRMRVATTNGQKQIAEEEDKQHKDVLTFAEKRLELEKLIQGAQGDTLAEALAGIDKLALKQTGEGMPADQIARLRALSRAQAQFKDLEKQGGLAMGGLSTIQGGLQTGVAAGDLFPYEALLQYDRAVQAALPHLRQLAADERAAATTDEDRMKAAQFTATIEQMAVASDSTARRMAQLKQGIESGVQQAFTNFFTTGIEQAHSFGGAMAALALDVVRSLQQIAAQMLATLATQKLLNLVGLGSGAAGGASIATEMMNATLGLAGGGSVPGIGSGDTVPAMLTPGEFVMRRAAVQSPGTLALLQQINRGMQPFSFRSIDSYRRGYAEGGLVEPGGALGGDGGGGNGAHVVVSLSEGLVAQHIESGPGSKAVIRSIGANRNAVKAALGIR
jgi:hypothetical protein